MARTKGQTDKQTVGTEHPTHAQTLNQHPRTPGCRAHHVRVLCRNGHPIFELFRGSGHSIMP